MDARARGLNTFSFIAPSCRDITFPHALTLFAHVIPMSVPAYVTGIPFIPNDIEGLKIR